jgi:predicted HicB family RNase H-like nuclease
MAKKKAKTSPVEEKAGELLRFAEEEARAVETWADLWNALFDPLEGAVGQAFPSRKERAEFLKTEEFKKIRVLIDEARERTGLVAGATPKKSGRFVVRLPVSLHESLVREARHEGVSLNQLVVAKLSAPLGETLQRSG